MTEPRCRFAGRSEFDGNRWDNLHYTRAFKQAAPNRHVEAASGRVSAAKRPETASTNLRPLHALEEESAGLAPSTLKKYADVLELLQSYLNGYAYESLPAEESALFDRHFNAKGKEHQEFCQLFGPDKIVENLEMFLGYFVIRKVMAGEDFKRTDRRSSGDNSPRFGELLQTIHGFEQAPHNQVTIGRRVFGDEVSIFSMSSIACGVHATLATENPLLRFVVRNWLPDGYLIQTFLNLGQKAQPLDCVFYRRIWWQFRYDIKNLLFCFACFHVLPSIRVESDSRFLRLTERQRNSGVSEYLSA